MNEQTFLLVGLGNPGKDYEFTRHNFGFIVLNNFCNKHNISLNYKSRFNSILGSTKLEINNILVLFPLTYMNLSGIAVKEIVKYYNISLNQMLVIYDDIDLPFGEFRLKYNGSSGGHKGVESIIYNLQSKEFNRLRLGIGPKVGENLSDFVLSNFSNKEKEELPIIINESILAIETFIFQGINKAMEKFNKKKVINRIC